MKLNKWKYHYSVRDDGFYIWENGEKVAVIHPDHFKYILADLAKYLKHVGD